MAPIHRDPGENDAHRMGLRENPMPADRVPGESEALEVEHKLGHGHVHGPHGNQNHLREPGERDAADVTGFYFLSDSDPQLPASRHSGTWAVGQTATSCGLVV